MRVLLALLATTSLAQAADLSRRAEPPRPPIASPYTPASWTGFYIGAHGGWASGDFDGDLGYNDPAFPDNTASDLFGSSNASISADGFMAGGQIGYNLQMGSLILGVEADASWSDVKGNDSFVVIGGDPSWNIETKLKWLATARARLGYAVTDAVMIYGTGGAAFGGTSGTNSVVYNLNDPPTEIARGEADATHVGWTAGAGLEVMLGSHWSVRAEYLYVDLGKDDLRFSGTQHVDQKPPAPYNTDSFSPALQFHIVRAGLNLRF